jgi:alpha-beta hydrolase superfamily lysophospholipase
MRSTTTTVTAQDGAPLALHRWTPEPGAPTTAVVQIAHGMAEHAQRYQRFAEHLVEAGYAVYALDHRGHGQSAASLDQVGHFADHDGWVKAVDDMLMVTRLARSENPDVPVFLFGHSMGSILSRVYAIKHGAEIDGLILSAAGGDPGILGKVAMLLAGIECRVRGRRARSTLLDRMTFGRFNDAFKPSRTSFDWLSRDQAEVDAYIADPWCGVVSTTGFFSDLFHSVDFVNADRNVAQVPHDLPIYLFSGDLDPVGDNTKGVLQVAEQYRRAGIAEVSCHFYPGARHETLNETNRDEVYADVVAWLGRHPAPAVR